MFPPFVSPQEIGLIETYETLSSHDNTQLSKSDGLSELNNKDQANVLL